MESYSIELVLYSIGFGLFFASLAGMIRKSSIILFIASNILVSALLQNGASTYVSTAGVSYGLLFVVSSFVALGIRPANIIALMAAAAGGICHSFVAFELFFPKLDWLSIVVTTVITGVILVAIQYLESIKPMAVVRRVISSWAAAASLILLALLV